MSEIKTIKVNGNEYQFVNESGSTRYGFYHRSELFKNGYNIGMNKVNYLNRTWECYRFQTSMEGLVYNLIDSRRTSLLNAFKENKGYKKMTQKRMEEFNKEYENDSIVAELKQVNEALK